MSVIPSATTYYVDINSEYRNLEKFQNPADFAVTFKTFTGTGYYPEGLPLDPVSPSSYFTPVSIDPDFSNAGLEVFGAVTFDIIRPNANITYLCGVTDEAGFFGIRYNGTVIARSDPDFIISNKMGFVARINSIFTNSILTGYEVPWINYIVSYPSVSTDQVTQDITIRLDTTNNLFVSANLNYD